MVDSTMYVCPGCGAKVIGHERCGDPSRPGCVALGARPLNARAQEAWRLVEAESEFGFEADEEAFVEGWETGYKAATQEACDEIERCALVLATENDEAGNYLVAAVLKKAADIVRTNAGLEVSS